MTCISEVLPIDKNLMLDLYGDFFEKSQQRHNACICVCQVWFFSLHVLYCTLQMAKQRLKMFSFYGLELLISILDHLSRYKGLQLGTGQVAVPPVL